MNKRYKICVIGAGTVGYATGEAFLARGREVYFVDKNKNIERRTPSRCPSLTPDTQQSSVVLVKDELSALDQIRTSLSRQYAYYII